MGGRCDPRTPASWEAPLCKKGIWSLFWVGRGPPWLPSRVLGGVWWIGDRIWVMSVTAVDVYTPEGHIPPPRPLPGMIKHACQCQRADGVSLLTDSVKYQSRVPSKTKTLGARLRNWYRQAPAVSWSFRAVDPTEYTTTQTFLFGTLRTRHHHQVRSSPATVARYNSIRFHRAHYTTLWQALRARIDPLPHGNSDSGS